MILAKALLEVGQACSLSIDNVSTSMNGRREVVFGSRIFLEVIRPSLRE